MSGEWVGAALVASHRLVYAGAIGPTETHAHHAVQIMIVDRGAIALRDGGGTIANARAFVVPSDAPHAIVGEGEGLLLFLAPEDRLGRKLRPLAASADVHAWIAAAEPLLAAASSSELASSSMLDLRPEGAARGPSDLDARATAIATRLFGAALPSTPTHPAIRRLLATLPTRLDGDVSLAGLARVVELSPGRLGHLFTESVGIPLRPYVLWLRLQRAIAEVAGGASLTVAAHAAGFADGAHLSRTFRRMVGLAPSEVAGQIRWWTMPAASSP